MNTAISSSAIIDAVSWLNDALLGSVAVSISIIAVAAVGVFALQGRLAVARGATIIVGCFILFSAAMIASALVNVFADDSNARSEVAAASQPIYSPAVPKALPYDPYAGASVPVPRQSNSILQ